MDTQLYDISIPIISSLQTQLSPLATPMQLLSVIFDPKYAFLIYSPIAYLVDQKVGRKLILTTVMAEWLNMILKWCLHGERPYWYVHSSGHFDPQQVPIKQFPITCELGPGHPSGHAMVTAAVWYIILDSMLHFYQSNNIDEIKSADSIKKKQHSQLPMKLFTWLLFTVLLITVSLSRVYLGCHFPHQCLAGSILGIIVARWVSRLDSKPLHFITASAFLLTTAFGTFGLLQQFGFDPSWTIKLATRYCDKREYIHLDTAPFFSIMRYCGFAFGTGLGLYFPLSSYYQNANCMADSFEDETKQKQKSVQLITPDSDLKIDDGTAAKHNNNLSWFSVKILMALLMARLVDNLGLFVSHANLPLFYSSAFCAYTLFSYAFINLQPPQQQLEKMVRRQQQQQEQQLAC